MNVQRAVQGGLCGVIVTACLTWAALVTWPIPQLLEAHVEPVRVDGSPRTDTTWPSLASAVSHPMFQAGGSSPSVTAPARPGAPSADAGTLASRLSVSGVVLGESSQAVIEDSQTKKTSVVTVGQSFIDGVVVEAIQADRVILNRQGERIELIR